MDLGQDLGYAAPTPSPAAGAAPTPQGAGSDPYAGMSDADVAAAVTAGRGSDGVYKMRIYNPDNPEVVKHIASVARADAAKPAGDLGSDLGYDKPIKLTADMDNDAILSHLGYSDKDISKLKTDPVYKAFEKVDGADWMAKDIQTPGSMLETMRKIPSIGAFLHGADQAPFGVAQLLTHAAHSIGAVPETTPALFDALSKLQETEYQESSGVKEDEYTIPKLAGGMAAGLAGGTLAAGAKAATLASGAAKPVATRLLQLAGSTAKVGAAGAGGAATLAPTTAIPSEISQDSRDQFWGQKGDDAQMGALAALGMHGLMKTLFKAGVHIGNKTEVAAKITSIINKYKQNMPQGSEGFKKTLDELTPLFSKPEYAERELNFASQGVAPTYGDVSQTGFANKTERAAKSMPMGLGGFRHDIQQPQLQGVARSVTTEAFDRMINTKWGGRAQLEEAAKGTGRYAEDAKKVLQMMDEAGSDSAKILQAEGKGENIRKLLIKEKLFKARDDLAGRAAISPSGPLAVANKILESTSHASVPNKGFQGDIGAYARALTDPAMPKNYASFQNDIHNLSTLIKKYGADTYEGVQLGDIKKAFQRSLDDFTNNVTKYAKSERYGIAAKDTKPYFSSAKGGGYEFDALVPKGAVDGDPKVRLFADKGAAQTAGAETAGAQPVKLRSPIIVEGQNGLSEFKQKLGLPDSATDAEVTDKAIQYAKSSGHDGVVFTWNGVPRQVVDMTSWKRAIGDANNRAQKFFKEVYKPAIESGTVHALRQANPDEVFDQFIKAGKENRAQGFFDSLGAKGKASIQYELIKRAVKAGTDSDGNITPSKVADYLTKRNEAAGVFFKGEDKWALDGFIKLMAHSKEAAPSAGGGHGVMGGFLAAEGLIQVAEGIATGGAGRAIRKGIATAAGLAGAGKAVSKIATSDALRHYMLAASDLKPGSPAMQKVYDKFMAAADLAVQAGTAQNNGGTQ